MKKDKLQTIVLVILIINSLVLTHQIWVSKKLWSKDYNFFANWTKIPVIQAAINTWTNKSEQNLFSKYKHLFNPQRIVINEGGKKAVVYKNTEKAYETLFSNFKEVFVAFLKAGPEPKHVTLSSDIKENEWFNALKSRSLYVDLGIQYKTKLLGQLLGVRDIALSPQIQNIQEVIIVLSDKKPEEMTIYIKNSKDGTVDKFEFKHTLGAALNGSIQQFAQQSSSAYMYAFEYGFTNPNPLRKATLVPEVLVTLQKQTASAIRPHNPLLKGNTQNIAGDKVDWIIRAFDYNPSQNRTYTLSDNSLVYVENNSTLKIHPDGFIEYTAIDGDKGLKMFLDDGSNNPVSFTQFDVIDQLITLIENMGMLDEKLHISSITDIQDRSDGFKITFDYYHNGIPIAIDTQQSSSQQKMHNAIEVEIINGYLKSYKQYIRDYTEVGKKEINITMQQAFDQIVKNYSNNQNEVSIEDIFLAYSDLGGGSDLDPQWGFLVKGQNEIHTVPALK